MEIESLKGNLCWLRLHKNPKDFPSLENNQFHKLKNAVKISPESICEKGVQLITKKTQRKVIHRNCITLHLSPDFFG